MNHSKVIADTLNVSERHARRLIAQDDERATAILEGADPLGFAIRQGCEGLSALLEHHQFFSSKSLLTLYRLDGLTAKLPAKTRRLLEDASLVGLAVEEAAWRAVAAWHKLDMGTIHSGLLADRYKIATLADAEITTETETTDKKKV